MPWTILDLALLSGATYGLAWLLTRSSLLKAPRQRVAHVPFVGELSRCIVCMAVWIGLGLVLLLPHTTLFSVTFVARTPADVLVLLGWILASSWVLGRLLGDAD